MVEHRQGALHDACVALGERVERTGEDGDLLRLVRLAACCYCVIVGRHSLGVLNISVDGLQKGKPLEAHAEC